MFGQYEYHFNDRTKFTQSAEALLDLEQMSNYLLNSETAFTAALNSVFSIKTSYVIKYDNETTGGTKHTDTILAASLVANF
ncbi:DUF481 domain-containing protein [Desulfuromonas sp. DDH964]|uniref:DUF481 domain-containing protein n=1 Tax=Desulfuromonas sp. DDH964 TaxID=1823759 RepID=UPI003FA48727